MDTNRLLIPVAEPIEIDPTDFDGWTLFGTDFNAHYVTGHVDEGRGTLLVAACGARQQMHRCEAISAPLFRCMDCLQCDDIPVEAK